MDENPRPQNRTQMQELLDTIIHKLGYTTRQVADYCGVTPNTIWRYRAGSVAPSYRCMVKLAEMADMPLPEVLMQRLMDDLTIAELKKKAQLDRDIQKQKLRHRQYHLRQAHVTPDGGLVYEEPKLSSV